ncbi:conserved hypothetical protein [Leishmania major strain Friedlin]|uniref:Uncharacterized protein n=1 Tax=Leishmania major TaxID=5664 RepID=Q4Q262_LEIMA|nr:conserved hypothetical protein [Leishmania major strain Friedlin]CAG9583527.1 hypothetical_protein_-_conserved [Leishmania major strain Friedlin]CAJ08967.1 conserved hypothetical protein [Leishmania major strain Friedlin]|eukprot:XP_001686586.1 conserved hypothetical protein [Leishmania major strain Friedlin]
MQQLQVSACVLLLALLCVTTVRSSGNLQLGTWDVSTLVPGRGAVPPNYELTVQPGKWTVKERDTGRVGRLFDYAAARIGLVYAGVPSDEHALCRMPPSLILKLAAVRTDDGVRLECQTVWFSPSMLRSFENDGLLHRRFDPAEPLYSADSGRCLATPWRVRELYVAKLGDGLLLLTGVLVGGASGTQESCSVHLEVRYRPIASGKESSSSSSLFSIAMLLMVVAVRLLPRYILTRKGQLDKTSYRGRNPTSLTPTQRLHLLRQQKEVIEKMKAEDSANAAKRTAV